MENNNTVPEQTPVKKSPPILVFLIAFVAIVVILVVAIVVVRIVKTNSTKDNPSPETAENSELPENIDTSTKISDFIDIDIPEGFIRSDETNDSYYYYRYPEDDDSDMNSCLFVASMPTDVENATAVLETAISDLYPDVTDTATLPQIRSSKIHGQTWNWFKSADASSVNYFYATDYFDHTFFLEFYSGQLAPSECSGFRTAIVNSLTPVEQDLINR